ncbi:Uncharacterized protein conserved in bacteria [Moraxella caprae]|uniref:Uncharacterized protein conserved in bacteria n=2 Tax=Moraxella caprae TaxID=90240 RepID=A0A378QY13_9GAMM|nr:Uncharacterized protein conserved in bacteria [Moraxella caprae]
MTEHFTEWLTNLSQSEQESVAYNPKRQAILLCAGDKTGDKHFYQRMIPLAKSVYQAYLEQL